MLGWGVVAIASGRMSRDLSRWCMDGLDLMVVDEDAWELLEGESCERGIRSTGGVSVGRGDVISERFRPMLWECGGLSSIFLSGICLTR